MVATVALEKGVAAWRTDRIESFKDFMDFAKYIAGMLSLLLTILAFVKTVFGKTYVINSSDISSVASLLYGAIACCAFTMCVCTSGKGILLAMPHQKKAKHAPLREKCTTKWMLASCAFFMIFAVMLVLVAFGFVVAVLETVWSAATPIAAVGGSFSLAAIVLPWMLLDDPRYRIEDDYALPDGSKQWRDDRIESLKDFMLVAQFVIGLLSLLLTILGASKGLAANPDAATFNSTMVANVATLLYASMACSIFTICFCISGKGILLAYCRANDSTDESIGNEIETFSHWCLITCAISTFSGLILLLVAFEFVVEGLEMTSAASATICAVGCSVSFVGIIWPWWIKCGTPPPTRRSSVELDQLAGG